MSGFWGQDDGYPSQPGTTNGNGANGNGANGGYGANGASQSFGAGAFGGAQPRGPLSGRMGGPGAPSGGLAGRMGAATPPPNGANGAAGGPRNLSGMNGANQRARETLFYDIQAQVQNALINELDAKLDRTDVEKVRKTIEDLLTRILDQQGVALNRSDRIAMLDAITDEIVGLGPIEQLLRDDAIDEIMVNGPEDIYIEREGHIEHSDVAFRDEEHIKWVINRIIAPIGRHIDEKRPYVDARLKDGSRVNAVIRPLALNGPTLTIRKFSKRALEPDDLLRLGTLTPAMLEFVSACVQARLNIVVSGGTSSGKTTLLNILSRYIPEDQRIITIEDAAELRLLQRHVIRLESRPANVEGEGLITIRDLVANSLRMRPDRIIVGECRGAESLDMLQAMNTGHSGSMTTLHSNSPRDTLNRLETMTLMANAGLPSRAIREQIARAVQLIVHQERMRDGVRRITSITEVTRFSDDNVLIQDIFSFRHLGYDKGRVLGQLRPTGLAPTFMDVFEQANIHLSTRIFSDGGEGPWHG